MLTVAALLLTMPWRTTAAGIVHFVNVNSTNPVPPFTNWATAATAIQDAVDSALAGDSILVTNGTYALGGRAVHGVVTNRVAVDRPLSLRSVNGPQVTVIAGAIADEATHRGGMRCVYLGSGASLSGFTLTDGDVRFGRSPPEMEDYAELRGGGIWCETNTWVSNCALVGNRAGSGGGAFGGTFINCAFGGNSAVGTGLILDEEVCGGGAFWADVTNSTFAGNRAGIGGAVARCRVENCLLRNNSAGDHGGGAWASSLYNCTVVQNSASAGGAGGASECDLYNSIVYFNTASGAPPEWQNQVSCFGVNSCTTPLPSLAGSSGNVILNPQLLNFHLQASSPCINAGDNRFVAITNDLDGKPRIQNGTVDMGAYEYQEPASVISFAWLIRYVLPTDGSGDFIDTDGDGMSNWQEWRCQTNPRSAESALRILSVARTNGTVAVTWQSVSGVFYFLERSSKLPSFARLASNVTGQADTTTFVDTNAVPGGLFYRVGVEN